MTAPVLIMAGGTGGHVFPALAVADVLRQRQIPVKWLGTTAGLEAQIVPPTGIEMERLVVTGLRGKGVRKWLTAPWMLSRALMQARNIVRRLQPRLVLGMGGFVSGPGGVMARLEGIPLVIHEQNALPGTTNRYLAPLADRVLTGFDDAFPYRRAQTVGNPVRMSIANLPPPTTRFAERPPGRRRLLVLGGSQGAKALNELVPQALAQLPPTERPEVWHQAGKQLIDATLLQYAQQGVSARIEPFIDDMAAAYGWADLVVCRSGALTLAELACAGVGALLVPFPFAIDDHQRHNAEALVKVGAARCELQSQLTVERLTSELQDLLRDPERLLHMAMAARSLARPTAAADIADICLQAAKGTKGALG